MYSIYILYTYIHCILSINLLQFCGSWISGLSTLTLASHPPVKCIPVTVVCASSSDMSHSPARHHRHGSASKPHTPHPIATTHFWKKNQDSWKLLSHIFEHPELLRGCPGFDIQALKITDCSGILGSRACSPSKFSPSVSESVAFPLAPPHDTEWHGLDTEKSDPWQHLRVPPKTGSITVAMALDKRGCLNGTGAYFLSVQNSWRMWQLQFRRVCWILLEIRITQDIYDMFGWSFFRNQWKKLCRNPMVHNVSTLRTL